LEVCEIMSDQLQVASTAVIIMHELIKNNNNEKDSTNV